MTRVKRGHTRTIGQMNLPVHTTDTLLLDHYQGESIVDTFIHTILFHRLTLGRTVKPKETTNPIYDSLYYVKIADEEVEERVKEQVAQTMMTLRERASGTVALVFYHIQPSSGWFKKEERTEVEKWRIPVQWYETYDRSVSHGAKEERVRRAYESLLRTLMSVTLEPVLFSQGSLHSYSLPFEVMDSDKRNSLKEILQFIVSGPPKLGLF